MNRAVTGAAAKFRLASVQLVVGGENRSFSSRLRGGFRRATGPLRGLLLLFAAGASTFAADATADRAPDSAPEIPEEESLWDWSATVRGGLGYKDNVLLSDFFKESSIFT